MLQYCVCCGSKLKRPESLARVPDDVDMKKVLAMVGREPGAVLEGSTAVGRWRMPKGGE